MMCINARLTDDNWVDQLQLHIIRTEKACTEITKLNKIDTYRYGEVHNT